MSDESGHTHQQAPSRFLAGGKKLGQGSGDKFGQHPSPQPLPASEQQGTQMESLAEFHKGPLGTVYHQDMQDWRRCGDCGLSRPVLPGVSRKADWQSQLEVLF